jgi:hypothetical protein
LNLGNLSFKQTNMKKTLAEFKTSILQLEEQMKSSLTEGEGDDMLYPIYDGPLSVEEYFNSKTKILWILKEPYGKDNNGEDNSYSSWYSTWKYNEDYQFKNPTWRTIANASYSILRNTFHDNNSLKEEIFNDLGRVAWINLQKVPRNDSSITNDSEIQLAYEKGKELILRQIEACDPDIIICGGTFKFIGDDLSGTYQGTVGNSDYYGEGGKLVIQASHPAYWIIPRDIYTNELVYAAETMVQKSRIYCLNLFKIQLEKLSKDLNLELNYYFHFGYPESGFRFSKPEWKNIAIGFEFEKFLDDFFYGICIQDDDKEIELEGIEHLKQHLEHSDCEPTLNWPWWHWDADRKWNAQIFLELENGIFIKKIETTVTALLNKFKEIGQ